MIKILHARFSFVFWLAAASLANPVLADKQVKGGGKHPHKEHHERREVWRGEDEGRGHDRSDADRMYRERGDADFRPEHYFTDQHRTVMHDYYVREYHSGRCPPGLAKKHNGCLPPGQAKKWQIGRPLPRDVIYYDVPAGMLGYPPAGYRFVRVASDILMIAVGTGMVVDALTDLGAW